MEGEGTQGALDSNWTSDESESLIDKVREKSILWDTKSKENKNVGRKEIEWINIAAALRKDVEKCKGRWKYLRGHYLHLCKKKRGKSGDGTTTTPSWEYFQQLSFLSSHVSGNNQTSGNLSRNPAPDENDTIEFDEDAPHSVEDPCAREGRQYEDNDAPASKKMKPGEKLDNALLAYLDKKDKKDAIHYYCMGLSETLRKLSEAQSSYAQMRISQMMYEIQFPQFVPPSAVPMSNSVNNPEETGTINYTAL